MTKTWYSAHIVVRVVFKDGNQDHCPVMENIVVLAAGSADEALEKAESLGFAYEGDSGGSFTWDDRPAEWRFVGVRKIIEVRNAESNNSNISDNTEVTYLTFELTDVATLQRFMSGEPVMLEIVD